MRSVEVPPAQFRSRITSSKLVMKTANTRNNKTCKTQSMECLSSTHIRKLVYKTHSCITASKPAALARISGLIKATASDTASKTRSPYKETTILSS